MQFIASLHIHQLATCVVTFKFTRRDGNGERWLRGVMVRSSDVRVRLAICNPHVATCEFNPFVRCRVKT